MKNSANRLQRQRQYDAGLATDRLRARVQSSGRPRLVPADPAPEDKRETKQARFLKKQHVSTLRRTIARLHDATDYRKHGPLDAVYSDPACIARILDYWHLAPAAIERALAGKPFPCALRHKRAPGSRAVLMPGKSGQFMYAAYQGNSKNPRPVLLTLAEVEANRVGQYEWPDAALTTRRQMLGVWRGTLAVKAGVYEFKDPLPEPALPDGAARLPLGERLYAAALLRAFWRRVNLAKEFTSAAFKRDDAVAFAKEFRDRIVGLDFISGTCPDEQRRVEIWKLLIAAGVIAPVIVQGTNGRPICTLYRLVLLPRSGQAE